jgi:hypothetical protein
LPDPASPDTPSVIADLQAAAHTLGLQLVVVNARTDSDLETAFATRPDKSLHQRAAGTFSKFPQVRGGSFMFAEIKPYHCASVFERARP